MAIAPFQVLTNFKFEVGEALVHSSQLQGAVDGISTSANDALFSLKRLGLGLVTNFGLGATSVLGVLGQALKSSDNLLKNQVGFATLMSGNMKNLTGDITSFNDRMLLSKQILGDIAKDSKKFGLDENILADATKLTAGFLIPKGLAGQNLSGARDISRNLLKSAPVLGVNPASAFPQLQRATEGRAGGENVLFRRLAAETEVFTEKFGKVKNVAAAFNKLPLKERFELLNEGLGQFTKDAEALAEATNTFSRQFKILRQVFSGFDGILVPLGNALRGPLLDGIKQLINIVDTSGRTVFKDLAFVIRSTFTSVEGLAVNLLQLRQASDDMKKSLLITLIPLGFLFKIVRKVALGIGFLIIKMFGIAKVLAFIGGAFAIVGKVLGFIGGAIVRFVPVLAAWFALMQLISRAQGIAKVRDLKEMPGIMASISKSIARAGNAMAIVFRPLLMAFDAVAEFISPLFSLSFLMDKVAGIFVWIADIVETLVVLFHAFANILAKILFNLSEGKIFSAFEGVGAAAKEGMAQGVDLIARARLNADGKGTVANNVTNVGTVNINNKFKENLQPDRIAFTLKEQLLKASQNPVAARNGNFAISR